jgi:hypothetical protein
MYATLNLTCFAAYFAAFCGWGLLVGGRSGRAAWRPAIGLAACSVASTLGYESGLGVAACGRVVFAVGALGLVAWAIDRRSPASRPSAPSLAVGIAAPLLLLAPMVVGGPQFGLFQGNINDQFNYLASSVERVTESHAAIAAAGPADFLRHSLLPIAHTMAGARPAVVDLYAAFEGLAPGNLHQCQYGFLCALLLASYFAVGEGVRCLTGGAPWRAWLVSLAFVAGFWGQLQIDLNAWSWVAATPLAAVALAMVAGVPRSESSGPAWRGALVLGLCAAGLVYLYPEMFAFLAPPVAVAAFVFYLLGRRAGGEVPQLGLPVVVALVLLAPKAGEIAGFIAHQISFSSRADFTPLDWVWNAMVGGTLETANSAEALLRWVAGGAGLGWLLGDPRTSCAAVTLAAAAVTAVAVPRRTWRFSGSGGSMVALVGIGVTAEAAGCIVLGHRWIGAKALSYESFVLLPLLLSPLATGRISLRTAPAWLLLLSQLAFGLLRPIGALAPDGIHYHLPYYPAVMDPALKTVRRWDVGQGPSLLRSSHLVKIDVPDLWLETYAAICAQSQGVPYFKGLPVYIYLGISDAGYGTQASSPDFDSLIYLDYDPTGGSGLGFAREDGLVIQSHEGARIARIDTAGRLDTTNGLLSWRIPAVGPAAATRITVAKRGTHPAIFEIGLIAPASAKGAYTLHVQPSRGSPTSAAILGFGPGVIQGIRVPLGPGEGGEIALWLEASGGPRSPATGISLVNPRVYSAGR